MASRPDEATRQRETFKYDAAAFANNAFHDATQPISEDTLRGSADTALTAFAQLATFRLNAARALISVFDGERQYVIAEATRSLPLDPSSQHPGQLSLCGAAIPRSAGICEHILNMDGPLHACDPSSTTATPLPVSIVPDLSQDSRFKSRAYLRGSPNSRFYAGVPLRSPRGIDIGALCVFDDQPRDRLDDISTQFMRDMSKTIMQHMESRRSGDASRRSTRMVRGLGSFVEGHGSLSDWRGGLNDHHHFQDGGNEGNLHTQQQSQRDSENSEANRLVRPEPVPVQSDSGPNQGPEKTQSSTSVASTVTAEVESGEDQYLSQVKQIFSRAANIVRESIEVEGVLFLDASIRSLPGIGLEARRGRSTSDTTTGGAESSSSDDDDIAEPAADPEMCDVFGFSTSDSSSIDDAKPSAYQINVPESLLRSLLKRYSKGKVFNFLDDGTLDSGDEFEEEPVSRKVRRELTKDLIAEDTDSKEARPTTRQSSHSRSFTSISEGKSLIQIIPGARSVAVVPLWDAQKERWFATGLIWTKTPGRAFTLSGEISYLRAFGMAVMTEISRANTLISDKSKTDVLSSLSHELRTPLHGIAAAVEMFHDTRLDAFQGHCLHTLESCGRTLLDVIDHLLDYTKINCYRNLTKTQRLEQNRPRSVTGALIRFSTVDLAALAEESVESMYAGFHSDIHGRRYQNSAESMEPFGHEGAAASKVSVYLDIEPNVDWHCRTQPGAMRRIIMNLFGNSLKYTQEGFISVTLKLERSPSKSTPRSNFLLTINDSGCGIGSEFLRTKIFTPFCQEDGLTQGTGLGLSVVYEIVRMFQGTIKVESQLGMGTCVMVNMPLRLQKEKEKSDVEFQKHLSDLSGLRVCLVGLQGNTLPTNESSATPGSPPTYERGLTEKICRGWLNLQVVDASNEEVRPDLMICSETALGQAAAKADAESLLLPAVVICHSAASAYRFTTFYHAAGGSRVAEFISRPVGPRKLAKALMAAFDRWKDNGQSSTASSVSEEFATPSATASAVITSSPGGAAVRGSDSSAPTSPRHGQIEGTSSVSGDSATGKPRGEVFSLAENPETAHMDAKSSFEVQLRPLHAEKHFLLVDDNKVNLQILTAYMKKLKHPFKTAMNGLEALEVFEAEPQLFSCILMDISMPIMDGLESTRRIRALERKKSFEPIPIFALTGLASADVQKEAFASGIDVFLTKPLTFKNLTNHLAERSLT